MTIGDQWMSVMGNSYDIIFNYFGVGAGVFCLCYFLVGFELMVLGVVLSVKLIDIKKTIRLYAGHKVLLLIVVT